MISNGRLNKTEWCNCVTFHDEYGKETEDISKIVYASSEHLRGYDDLESQSNIISIRQLYEDTGIPHLTIYNGYCLLLSVLGKHYQTTVDILDSIEHEVYDYQHYAKLEEDIIKEAWDDYECKDFLALVDLDFFFWDKEVDKIFEIYISLCFKYDLTPTEIIGATAIFCTNIIKKNHFNSFENDFYELLYQDDIYPNRCCDIDFKLLPFQQLNLLEDLERLGIT